MGIKAQPQNKKTNTLTHVQEIKSDNHHNLQKNKKRLNNLSRSKRVEDGTRTHDTWNHNPVL